LKEINEPERRFPCWLQPAPPTFAKATTGGPNREGLKIGVGQKTYFPSERLPSRAYVIVHFWKVHEEESG